MTEPARLYWKDVAVLEQARGEFVDYLDAVRRMSWERVQELWQEDPQTSKLQVPRVSPAGKDSGHWWTNLGDIGSTGFGVDVFDPRLAETTEHDTVKLTINQSALRRLTRQRKSILREMSEVASGIGIALSWTDSYSISVERVELNPDDATDTAQRLAEKIYQYLQVLVVMEEKFGQHTTST
jgi:hypothetical protein